MIIFFTDSMSCLRQQLVLLCTPVLLCILVLGGAVSRQESAGAAGPERLIDHFPEAAGSGCMQCHRDIEPIREIGSEMLNQIMEKGKAMGDPAGCVVCHNGDPNETRDVELAHGGDDFYPDPGSPWVNAETCGDRKSTRLNSSHQ